MTSKIHTDPVKHKTDKTIYKPVERGNDIDKDCQLLLINKVPVSLAIVKFR